MDEAGRAYERALSFLEKRDRTERELYGKLSGAGFSEEAVSGTLDRLRENGLINDESYAERYLQALMAKGRGRLRIAQDMRMKGLAEELVRNTIEDGLSAEDELKMAKDAARRCLKGLNEEKDLRKKTAKVSRRLASLGFTWDVIGSAMRSVRIEEEDDVS